jgi:molybdenum cofactor guanylyltransferase
MLPTKITCIILAGGLSTRMGGRNKALISVEDKTLIEHSIDAIRNQVDHIVISANRNLPYLETLGFPVVEDQNRNQGPLAGIVSAATHVDTNLILVSPCDVINIPGDFAKKVTSSLIKTKSEIAIAKTNLGVQYLNFALTLGTLMKLKLTFSQGARKVSEWQQGLKQTYVNFDDHDGKTAFANLNTPEDLKDHNLFYGNLTLK